LKGKNKLNYSFDEAAIFPSASRHRQRQPTFLKGIMKREEDPPTVGNIALLGRELSETKKQNKMMAFLAFSPSFLNEII
jgi:hypothetical protein